MADNVEKFLIDFVFKDDKALGKIKEFVGQYDKLNKKVRESSRVSQRASQEKARATKKATSAVDKQARSQAKLNTLEQRRLELRKRIARAEELGLKASGFKTTATASNSADNIRKRTIELNKQIFAQEQKIKAEQGKQAASIQKTNSALERKAKLERSIALSVGAMKRNRSFEALAQQKPQMASGIVNQYERGLRTGGVEGANQINAARDALRKYGDQALRTKRKVMSLKTAQTGLADSTRHMIRAYASLFTVLAGVNQINKVGQGFEAMESAMLAAMGSQEEATANIEFLDQMTSRLGLSLLDTADQYTKFVFASKGKLDTDQVNEFFNSVAEAGTVLGVSKERMKLSFNALQQMLNKTTVQSEELKRQLAESFPGAIQIFARAIGKTEEEMFKMMENGELLAADIFPDVAKEMSKVANAAGALEAKYKTTRVAQGRFFKELETSSNAVFKGGFDEALAAVLNDVAEFLRENKQALASFGRIFQVVFRLIGAAIKVILPVVESLISSTGELFNIFDQLFGDGSGEIILGIYAITKAVKMLSMVSRGWVAILLTALGLVDEIISPFVQGRIGLIEKAIGKDLSLNPDFESKNWISMIASKGKVGTSGANPITYININQENHQQLPPNANEEHILQEQRKYTEELFNKAYAR
jgi:tape measure domain-containing protein